MSSKIHKIIDRAFVKGYGRSYLHPAYLGNGEVAEWLKAPAFEKRYPGFESQGHISVSIVISSI